jgi:hypothetical protein
MSEEKSHNERIIEALDEIRRSIDIMCARIEKLERTLVEEKETDGEKRRRGRRGYLVTQDGRNVMKE